VASFDRHTTLSGKLIHPIEAHQEQITASVVREIRRCPDLAALCKLSDAELRERGQQIPDHLGHWLSENREADIEQRYEMLGRGALRGIHCAARIGARASDYQGQK
jgi:hypothetical protein